MVETKKTTLDIKRTKAEETTLFALNHEAKRKTAMSDKSSRLRALRKEAEAIRLKSM